MVHVDCKEKIDVTKGQCSQWLPIKGVKLVKHCYKGIR